MARNAGLIAILLIVAFSPPRDQPISIGDARPLFKQCSKMFQEKKYGEAIEGFRKIFECFPMIDPGPRSAYNIACAYALTDRKTEALDWLAKAIDAGHRDPAFIERDKDLETIRGEKRYRELIGDLQAIHVEWDVDRNGQKDIGDAAKHLEKALERFIAASADPGETAKLIARLESSTVMVLTGSGSGGTGVLLKTEKSRYVVTAGHVAAAGAVKIRLRDGRELGIKILKQEFKEMFDVYRLNGETASDLAICKIDGEIPDDLSHVVLAANVEKGNRVFVVGHPGLYGRKTGGAIGDLGNAFRGANKLTALTNVGTMVMQAGNFLLFSPSDRMRVPPLVGNSGSPLFNERGELVGIAVTTNARMDVALCGCAGLETIRSYLKDVETEK